MGPGAKQGKFNVQRDAMNWLRNAVVIVFVAAIMASLFLPVYTDEVGWRFQERAGFDGVDKMFADACGTNTLARPPFFMMPVRYFSAFLNSVFADPLFVRLSGILYALIWTALVLKLVRLVAPKSDISSATLGIWAIGLLGLGVMPFLMVLSRPEQPIILCAATAIIIALQGWRDEAEETPPRKAWGRSLAILALGLIALSYHLKALFLLPLFLTCLVLASRGRPALRARAAAGGALVAFTGVAALYWVERLQCPDDPLLRAAYAANNIGAVLVGAKDMQGVLTAIGQVFSNLNLWDYVERTAPAPFPLSAWLPEEQVTPDTYASWGLNLFALWALAMLTGLIALVSAVITCWRQRRIDPRPIMAIALMAAVLGWSATQSIRNFYEAGFVLPLLALAITFALSGPGQLGVTRKLATVLAGVIAAAAVISPLLIAQIWAPSLQRAAQHPGYAIDQRHSISVFGYADVKPQIMAAARLCGIPEPKQANAVMIDDLTYFAFMESRLPQHYLGVVSVWRGSITDPVAYLKSRQSDGAIVGCQKLPPDLRARARSQDGFCCLGPPNW